MTKLASTVNVSIHALFKQPADKTQSVVQLCTDLDVTVWQNTLAILMITVSQLKKDHLQNVQMIMSVA